MKRLFKTIPVVVAIVLIVSWEGHAQPVDEPVEEVTVDGVLSRYVEAMGGRETIGKLTSRMSTGTQTTDFLSREHPSYESLCFETRSKAPTYYVYQTWSSQGDFEEGFDGAVGWVKDKCGVRNEERISHSKLAFLLNPQGSLHLESYFPELTYVGSSTRDSIEAQVLVPSSLPPEHYTLYFSVDSGLLVGIGYYWVIGDYREVDGVMIPHRIATSRKGGSTVYEIKAVEHNAVMNDSLFAMPEN